MDAVPTHPLPASCRVRQPSGTFQGSTEVKSQGQVVDSREVEVEIPNSENIKNPAYVHIKAGITESIGNYEFVRIDVGVTLPCVATDDAIEAARQRASQWVKTVMQEERNQAIGAAAQPANIASSPFA